MKFLERYKKKITLRIDTAKEEFIQNISKEIKNLKVLDDKAEISFKPSFFDPYAPRGVIKLSLTSSDNSDVTIINCELIPTSVTSEGVYALIFGLSLMSILSLIISVNFSTFVIIALGWVILGTWCHFTQLLSRGAKWNHILSTK